MSNSTASDVITYIGVPLAVLGVVPMMYTCFKSLITLRVIQRTLDFNGVSAITRSTLLSGIVEVEIPRKSIIPLNRSDPEYFELCKSPSTLKGGSWTIFNWKEMAIGIKCYRLQYHDELAQPQAEVNFEQLVAFLLDRGAVPSPVGFDDLRNLGLWTPAGTKLLLAPSTADPVLMVSTPEDSDGILSLCLQWNPEWDRRGAESLPPYFVRIKPPTAGNNIFQALKALKEQHELENQQESSSQETEVKSAAEVKEDDQMDREDTLTSKTSYHFDSAFRLRIGPSGIQEAYEEDNMKSTLNLSHLRGKFTEGSNSPGFWFTCGATALGAPQGGLWSFAIPADIIALTGKDSIPCGVMVLLEFMKDEEVPTWRTPHSHDSERFERSVQLMNRSRAIADEMRLPPAQQAEARQKRIAQEHMDFHHQSQRDRLERQRRKEFEMTEALTSQRLSITLVAAAARKWLIKEEYITAEVNAASIVEQALYGMIQSEYMALAIANMLSQWRSWLESGGMTKTHFQAVQDNKLLFALASIMLGLINEISDSAGTVVSDLQECLRIWRKVRLG